MNSESRRVRVAKALEGHIPRFINIYCKEVDYLARVYNLSWEQMYLLLDSEREMPFQSDDLEWAKQQPPVVIQAEELQSRGRLGVELSPDEFSQEMNCPAASSGVSNFQSFLITLTPQGAGNVPVTGFKSTLSMEAVIATEVGFRQGLNPQAALPAPYDLSPWAVGFRLARKFKEELDGTQR